MFQKPTFGNTSTGFGSFNAGASTSSPFGGFKPAGAAGGFGAAPAFGATAATGSAPAQGSFFGASSTPSTGLFGAPAASAAPAPAFGATTSSFGFGANTSTGGLFGANTSAGGGLFGGQQTSSAFGAKPAGFGFGTTPTQPATGGLFGAPAGGGLFGQQNTTMGGGLLNTSAGGFGQQQAGTGHVKYNPVVGTDVMVKGGTSQSINIKHHCITCMKEYEGKSLEELRVEDYAAGRKGAAAGGAGVFGAAKPLFGGGSFGQPATSTAAPSLFSGGGAMSFGQTNSAFSFGQPAQSTAATAPLFGANKPAFGAATPAAPLFGAATTQAPAFGATSTPSFGFGANTQNQSTGIFGAKPASTGFGATPATGGAFGGFGGGGLFGAKPGQGAAPALQSQAPAFGSTAPAFGTATSTAGSLFSGGAFGKPAAQSGFGFGNTQPSTGLGGGLGGGLGATPFGQSKPATGFPSMFNNPAPMFGGAQPSTQLNFNSAGGGLGGGSLGGGLGMFNTGSTLGAPANTFNSFNTNNSTLGASAAPNVHEQMLTLAARPYGDSPLFKNLPESTTTMEDVLKPTNPAQLRGVLERSGGYRVTSPEHAPQRTVRPVAERNTKKSLFDGLEESDPSLEERLSLKPSRKRLVLRPQQNRQEQARDQAETNNNRSLEESTNRTTSPRELSPRARRDVATGIADSGHVDRLRGVNTDLETSSERHGSWLGSSKLSASWDEGREPPVDNQPTPRIYPDLDKELPGAISERRASWLTTKPLRKKSQHSEPVDENSVRELRTEPAAARGLDKENVDILSVSEEENVSPREGPPHPTGVKLTRPGYYTIPALDDMISYIRQDGRCVVPHLTIGRKNYGNVFYDCEIDVTGLDIDSLVHFLNKEVIVYPEDADKPPVGQALNRRAVVTLDRVWPRDKTEKRPLTDPQRLLDMDYEGKLRRVCDKHDTKFIEYRPQTGSWVFRVEHFSKYGLTDSDEEDDVTPDVLRRQLVHTQALQKNAAPAQKAQQPLMSVGLGGLTAADDSLFAMQQTSLNLLNGAGKAFETNMDTEENGDMQSLYSDTHRAYGVKSPTAELARLENRHSHNVQLMKASLYANADMEDDASVSTEDQLVPVPRAAVSLPRGTSSTARVTQTDSEDVAPASVEHIELPMKPLIVRPNTIVLQYHRKVPPFKQTIAGRLDASCIADMSVSRARHSRVGFAPGNTLAYVTTHAAAASLPATAELSALGEYVRGRGADDWSEAVVARVILGGGSDKDGVQDYLSGHLQALLDFSTLSDVPADRCPQLSVDESPRARRELLERHLREAEKQHRLPKFGVSGGYCAEVWKLCEALWAADLENDGVPGTSEQDIVGRHSALLEWLTAAVADITDQELSRPCAPEDEDPSDGHSARVWTLLLGGRTSEACKVARERADLHMAALLSQASGDETFRSLVARQLSTWQQCGAQQLIAKHRLFALSLLSGQCGARELSDVHWLCALHATARYLAPQVPSLEQIVTKYESMFYKPGSSAAGDRLDVTVSEEEETGMAHPLPPYQSEFDASVRVNGVTRRVLDLRYQLIHARAMNTRPRLQPAAYTPDPLDYSLCFLLGTWLGSPTVDAITGVAEQLEASGAWHLAIQALLYHPDEAARSHLVRGVLARHAPARHADTRALALLRRLRVPEQWTHLASAHRAKYEHLPAVEAEHLVAARQWSAAHRVLLDELLPTTVLADNLESIAPLLEAMNEAAARHEISGWESGGQALHHYLHVCNEIRSLVSGSADREGLQSRLEALRPRIAAACRALQANDAKSPRHSAARAEMGARLLQSALAAGEPPAHLAALLQALRLPPDCSAAAQHKITTELAQLASESCAETAAAHAQSPRADVSGRSTFIR